MPSASNAARSSSPANGSRFATRRSATLDDGHLARAESLPRLRHLDADDAATEHHEPFGHVARRRRPATVPHPDVAESVDRRDHRARARREHHREACFELAHLAAG